MTQLAFDNILSFPSQTIPPPIIAATSPSGVFSHNSDTTNSDGRTKAQKAAPLRSYSDYQAIKNFFLSTGNVRNAALLTIGIATGLRISDLTSLCYGHICTKDASGNIVYRQYIAMNEHKTGKKTYNSDDRMLVTDAIKQAVHDLSAYTIKKEKRILSLDDWLFPSKQPRRSKMIKIEDDDGNVTEVEDPLYGEKVITTAYGHRVMKDAQKALGLPMNIGSHTLRKTFACLALVIAKRSAPNNVAALETVQTLLRHDNVKTTLRYLEITNQTTTNIRNEISNFLLGKSTIIDII